MTRLGVALILVFLSNSNARAEPPIVDASPSTEPGSNAPSTAPPPTPDLALVAAHAQDAREAARTGNCEAAREAHEAAHALDPSYGQAPLDPAVAICLGPDLTYARWLRAAHEAAVAGRCSHARDVVELLRLDGLDARSVTSTAVHACLVKRPGEAAERREVTANPANRVPPLSLSRMVGGIALGTVLAIPGVIVGGGLGVAGGLAPAILGAYVGGGVGVALGVHAVGASGNQTGSLGATVFGAIVGGLAGVGLFYLDIGRGGGPDAGIAALVTPYVGALVGFNLTRRYKESDTAPRVGSIVMRTHDRWSIGLPVVVHAEHATTVSLVSGSF